MIKFKFILFYKSNLTKKHVSVGYNDPKRFAAALLDVPRYGTIKRITVDGADCEVSAENIQNLYAEYSV